MDIKDESRKNIEALKQKISGKISCPMCHHDSFSVIDGFTRNDIQTDLHSFQFGGAFLPTMLAVCNNCGFVSQHALGVIRDDIDLSGGSNGQS